MLSARFGTIFGPVVDEYFDFYAGGLIGMRGYPYYSISGNSMGAVGFAYRFPLSNDLGVRIFQIYFDKLYASVYGDAGDAWTGSRPTMRGLKTDLGMQLRMEAFSFYAYPTAIFFDAAYGLTKFDRYVRSANAYVTYGKEWRFYFGILFGFDFD
jgi:outer membrane translocation and assembly module TamA